MDKKGSVSEPREISADEARVYEMLKEASSVYEKYLQILQSNNKLENLLDEAPTASYLPYELV